MQAAYATFVKKKRSGCKGTTIENELVPRKDGTKPTNYFFPPFFLLMLRTKIAVSVQLLSSEAHIIKKQTI
jgi:hypothetical protein